MKTVQLLAAALLSLSTNACKHRAVLSPSLVTSRLVEPSRLAGVSDTMPEGTHYVRTHESPATMRYAGLCEIFRAFKGGAGLYRVNEITGVPETTNGSVNAFTYIRLDQIRAWTDDAPITVVARIGGGPAGGGVTKSWDVSVEIGEELGVLLIAPRSENLGYYGLHSLGLFRQKSGGFTNGQLQPGDIPSENVLVASLRRFSAGDCSDDIRPKPPVMPSLPRPVAVQAAKGETAPTVVAPANVPEEAEPEDVNELVPFREIQGRAGTK